MARGITDGEKDGFVFVTGFFKSLVAPRIPVHWIMGVLLKIRALLRNQMIGQMDFLVSSLRQQTAVPLFCGRAWSHTHAILSRPRIAGLTPRPFDMRRSPARGVP